MLSTASEHRSVFGASPAADEQPDYELSASAAQTACGRFLLLPWLHFCEHVLHITFVALLYSSLCTQLFTPLKPGTRACGALVSRDR